MLQQPDPTAAAASGQSHTGHGLPPLQAGALLLLLQAWLVVQPL
jgi:hypothetical protein